MSLVNLPGQDLMTERFGELGFLVGGAVRDHVAGLPGKDADYVVRGLSPSRIKATLLDAGCSVQRLEVGGRLVGLRATRDGRTFEVCPPRRDVSNGPGHRDFEILPISVADQDEMGEWEALAEDALRRDFSCNAMYVRLTDGRMFDPAEGRQDVADGAIRTMSPRAFVEDPLRILRMGYLMSRLGMTPDPQSLRMAAESGNDVRHVSRERIGDEMDKIMRGDRPQKAIVLLGATASIWHVLPSFAYTMGYDQGMPEHHGLELDQHLMDTLWGAVVQTRGRQDDLCWEDLALRYAALLHDVGKPPSSWETTSDGARHYYAFDPEWAGRVRWTDDSEPWAYGRDHAEVGAELAYEDMRGLRRSERFCRAVAKLVGHHMIRASGKRTQGRRLRRSFGDDALLRQLLDLRQADLFGRGIEVSDELAEGHRRLREQAHAAVREPCFRGELSIRGEDALAVGALGEEVGKVLEGVLDMVVGQPELNEKPDNLRRIAGQVLKDVRREARKEARTHS